MSCSDVQTIKAGDGSKTQFSFDFPYIFKSEIHVYFWNATTKEYDEKLTTDSTYPWRITDANPTIVEFTSTAPPSPATPVDPGESAVDNVKIRRVTKVDDIRALFNPGSAIRSDDLNKNFEQLRYAIQESNCQGIPDDVDQYLKDYYWDRYDNTLYDGDTWVSDDTKIATTAALDARFQDEVNDTFTKAELAAASNIMPDDDVAVPTTGALDNYINEVITNDIGSSDGVTITDDGDGTITVGLADNSVDFDKIKDADQIQLADQIADPDVEGTDNNIFTAKAATRRFNNYYQNEAPTATDGIGEGQVWVDPNDDLTLSVWSGSAWVGITSGGTFTNQPKVVYVDASSGDDANDGHRISRPKQSIKAAVTQINADDTHGDGSIVVVAPGVYQEACPIQIQKRDVAIVGTSVRNCVVHPTPATETATMFEVNSGTYLKNLTFTGMKASGTRGASGSLWEDATHGLPPTQGWNVAFFDDAMIYKSPYVQNCTNFSDSEIDNSDLDFYAGDEDKGRAGDLDSAPTGGGLLVDGSTPHADSPLRSIVCDSYTHTGLDAPGIFVTNNGYMQATSSYAFFNHAHITCINGGQANLAASTTDFGRFGLIASGKSTSAIFTSTIDGAVSDGAISFNIDAPTAASGWHGSATRPQGNMLVTVNSVTYPILSSTANGSGWTVTISRPNSSNRSENLGVNGAISDGAAVSFFLRSMIASSGHTMEYVGSGTDYRALPGNGGVPVEANQKIELDNGKIWTATTDQNGKFTVGGNQTDDPFFEVDQQLGFVTIPEGSIAFNLLSDETPQLGGNLDVNGRQIVTDSNNENIVLNPHGSGSVNVSLARITNVADPSLDQDAATKNWTEDTFLPFAGGTMSGAIAMGTNKITGVGDPTDAQDVATKNYVDTQTGGIDEVVDDTTPQLGGDLDVNGNQIVSTNNGDIDINPNGTGNIILDANVGIGTTSPSATLHANSGTTDVVADFESTDANAWIQIRDNSTTDTAVMVGAVGDDMRLRAGSNERVRIDSSGNLGVGTSSPDTKVHVVGSLKLESTSGTGNAWTHYKNADRHYLVGVRGSSNDALAFYDLTDDVERMRIDTSGNVQARRGRSNTVGDVALSVQPSDSTIHYGLRIDAANNSLNLDRASGTAANLLTIDSSGNVGIATSTTSGANLVIATNSNGGSGIKLIGKSANGGAEIDFRNNADDTLNGFIEFNDNGGILSTVVSQPQVFRTNNTERMRIDGDGRLLLGLTSSIGGDAIFQVQGSGNRKAHFHQPDSGGSIVQFTNTTTGTGTSDGFEIALNGSEDGQVWLYESGNIKFGTANSEAMRIDSSGNVGIGETSADTRLHIKESTTGGTGIFIQNSNGATGSSADLYFGNWNGSSTGTPQARIQAINTNVNNASTDLVFWTYTGSSIGERMRLDSSGRLGIGTSSPGNPLHIADQYPTIRLQSNSGSYQGRNTLGQFDNLLYLECDNDNAIADSAMVFTVDAGEKMRIGSGGRTSMAHDGSYYNGGATLSVSASANDHVQIGRNTNAGFSQMMIHYYSSRSASSSFRYLDFRSAAGSDVEYNLRGDGQAYADGAWNGGGADYAEYFEWSDGNTEAEDRRGISVVLDGDKIREAVDGEEPIGVISANPSVVGDTDIDRWKGKYLRDDFGTYLQDTHNVVEWDEIITDDDGRERVKKHSYEDWDIPDGIVVPADAVVSATDENGQPYTHRRLNPDYNPDIAYVSREDRPEWDTVGLMGKLRIRKGQVTGTRWIKMRDVSSSVEEWLVR